jgi:hypothetical protein
VSEIVNFSSRAGVKSIISDHNNKSIISDFSLPGPQTPPAWCVQSQIKVGQDPGADGGRQTGPRPAGLVKTEHPAVFLPPPSLYKCTVYREVQFINEHSSCGAIVSSCIYENIFCKSTMEL